MSINSVTTSSLLTAMKASLKDTSSSSRPVAKTSSESAQIDAASAAAEKKNAKLEQIKEEVRNAPVLPSSDKIAEKYGIPKAQAEIVLSQISLERATDAGGSPEQVVETATEIYMMAELSDSKMEDLFDVSEILRASAVKKEEETSAKELAEKNDITLEQAQEIINEGENNEESSSSFASLTSSLASLSSASDKKNDSSDISTYSVSTGNSSGSYKISTNSSSTATAFTVSYGA